MEIVAESPIDPGRVFLQIRRQGSGSILFHYAVVKGEAGGRVCTGILFERKGDMEAELAAITASIKERWNVDDVLLIRRLGMLKIGDVISLVAVSSPASSDAFEACRFGLERIKKMSTIGKTEMASKPCK